MCQILSIVVSKRASVCTVIGGFEKLSSVLFKSNLINFQYKKIAQIFVEFYQYDFKIVY